ncbi:MAG: glycosyltransferase family 1 protein [Pseudomonadota bacterium]
MRRVFLDVSRTISRLDAIIPTGIDRVERAYIDHVSDRYPDALAIGGFGKEYMISPLRDFLLSIQLAGDMKSLTFQDRFRLKLRPQQRLTKSLLRRRHGLMSQRVFLQKMKALSENKNRLLSVGHSRALQNLFSELSSMGLAVEFLLHDLIPVTHPEFCRPNIITQFKTYMEAIQKTASCVYAVSETTARSVVENHVFAGPVVARPGLTLSPQPWKPETEVPYFLVVGTVEPRKNLELLLDLWQKNNLPRLKIVGKSGWAAQSLFEKLENLKHDHRVEHLSEVKDFELANLYAGCQAILFPSHVEGFGLPLYEALSAGVPCIASDIPAFREATDGKLPLVDASDPEGWLSALSSPNRFISEISIPTWDTHFAKVAL